MDWNGRDKPIRNMLTESYPKDVHIIRPGSTTLDRGVVSAGTNVRESQSTEYRRSFRTGTEPKSTDIYRTAAGITSIPSHCTNKRHNSTKNFIHANLFGSDVKTDYTTSYMHDFIQPSPSSSTGKILNGAETRNEPTKISGTDSTSTPPGDGTTSQAPHSGGVTCPSPFTHSGGTGTTCPAPLTHSGGVTCPAPLTHSGIICPAPSVHSSITCPAPLAHSGIVCPAPLTHSGIKAAGPLTEPMPTGSENMASEPLLLNLPAGMTSGSLESVPGIEASTSPHPQLSSKKSASESGERMKTLLRYSNYLPNPIPEQRRAFDDDENANPTLKNFISMISRK